MLRVVHCKETARNETKIDCGKSPDKNLQSEEENCQKTGFIEFGISTTFAMRFWSL